MVRVRALLRGRPWRSSLGPSGEESDEVDVLEDEAKLPHQLHGSPATWRCKSCVMEDEDPAQDEDAWDEEGEEEEQEATKSVRSVSSRRSGQSRRLPSRSCGDLSQVAMTPRRTKSAKNFRRGRKRVMVAAMNAKKMLGGEWTKVKKPPSPNTAAERPPPEALLAFLRGVGSGPENFDLEQILRWDFDRWENQHNYIQWLFPTDEESDTRQIWGEDQPVVQEEMLVDPQVEDNLVRCLEKFLSFLGLDCSFDEDDWNSRWSRNQRPRGETNGLAPPQEEERKLPVKVFKNLETFRSRRVDCWVVNCPEGNHNWFRISRVLVSLRLLGLIDEAEAFYLCLESLWAAGDLPGFAVHSMRIWRESAGLEKRPLPKRQKHIEIPSGVPSSGFRNAIPNTKRYMKHNMVELRGVCEASYTGDYDKLQERRCVVTRDVARV
eukprot:g17246.t1